MTVVAKFEIHYTRFLDPTARPSRRCRDSPATRRRWSRSTAGWCSCAPTTPRRSRCSAPASSARSPRSSARRRSRPASAAPWRPEDVFLMTYRENGAQLMRGVTLKELFLYWGGDERGSRFRRAAPRLPDLHHHRRAGRRTPSGVAYAIKLRREPRVAVCALGDGATSKGDFYEGTQRRRRLAAAARLRRDQQPVGDLGAAPHAERGRRRSRRRRSPAGSRACRSTATTSSRCATRWTRRSPRRAPAAARR